MEDRRTYSFHMMAVPAQLAEMEIGWVLRGAALCYPLVVDVETWSFNSQNGSRLLHSQGLRRRLRGFVAQDLE
ncbi:MAG: hypothetical protein WCF37_15855, partial [Pseudolabrys sp.]